MIGGTMKLSSLIPILSAISICGCQSSKQEPVMVLFPYPDEATQNSFYSDKLAALQTNVHLEENPECRNYIHDILNDISTETPVFDHAFNSVPHDTSFDVRIELHQDGSIGNIAIYGYTNPVVTMPYIKAIKDCSPFPKWPDKMRSVVKGEYWVMYITCDLKMTPLTVGPN
jgi:hypothetical protein